MSALPKCLLDKIENLWYTEVNYMKKKHGTKKKSKNHKPTNPTTVTGDHEGSFTDAGIGEVFLFTKGATPKNANALVKSSLKEYKDGMVKYQLMQVNQRVKLNKQRHNKLSNRNR